MKILVTGCAGFIGSHTSERLLKLGYKVYGLDNLNDYYDVSLKKLNLEILYKYDNFKFYQEDIINTKIIDTVKPDRVIHLASMAGVRYSIENPILYVRVNIEGFINLLEQSVKNKVKNFVYASSSSVYGNNKVPFKENDLLEKINSPYAATKKCMEIMAQTYHQLYKIPLIGLRFFTVYGPRGRPDMAPDKFLRSIYKEKTINKYGSGESMRDYTYIDDIVSGVLLAMYNENNLGNECFNLGNSNPISLNKFIENCENIVGKKSKINYMSDQLGDVPATYANIEKAQKQLGYNPKIKLKEGLEKTFEWIKNN
jgi:UDP-glucuronate 4-epimerase